MYLCHNCNKEQEDRKISFRDVCDNCDYDLHVCLNCGFYDEHSYNECRESSAERLLDKEKANVCEYFKFKSASEQKKKNNSSKKTFDDLFD